MLARPFDERAERVPGDQVHAHLALGRGTEDPVPESEDLESLHSTLNPSTDSDSAIGKKRPTPLATSGECEAAAPASKRQKGGKKKKIDAAADGVVLDLDPSSSSSTTGKCSENLGACLDVLTGCARITSVIHRTTTCIKSGTHNVLQRVCVFGIPVEGL